MTYETHHLKNIKEHTDASNSFATEMWHGFSDQLMVRKDDTSNPTAYLLGKAGSTIVEAVGAAVAIEALMHGRSSQTYSRLLAPLIDSVQGSKLGIQFANTFHAIPGVERIAAEGALTKNFADVITTRTPLAGLPGFNNYIGYERSGDGIRVGLRGLFGGEPEGTSLIFKPDSTAKAFKLPLNAAHDLRISDSGWLSVHSPGEQSHFFLKNGNVAQIGPVVGRFERLPHSETVTLRDVAKQYSGQKLFPETPRIPHFDPRVIREASAELAG